jgi:hypothetical protein
MKHHAALFVEVENHLLIPILVQEILVMFPVEMNVEVMEELKHCLMVDVDKTQSLKLVEKELNYLIFSSLEDDQLASDQHHYHHLNVDVFYLILIFRLFYNRYHSLHF